VQEDVQRIPIVTDGDLLKIAGVAQDGVDNWACQAGDALEAFLPLARAYAWEVIVTFDDHLQRCGALRTAAVEAVQGAASAAGAAGADDDMWASESDSSDSASVHDEAAGTGAPEAQKPSKLPKPKSLTTRTAVQAVSSYVLGEHVLHHILTGGNAGLNGDRGAHVPRVERVPERTFVRQFRGGAKLLLAVTDWQLAELGRARAAMLNIAVCPPGSVPEFARALDRCYSLGDRWTLSQLGARLSTSGKWQKLLAEAHPHSMESTLAGIDHAAEIPFIVLLRMLADVYTGVDGGKEAVDHANAAARIHMEGIQASTVSLLVGETGQGKTSVATTAYPRYFAPHPSMHAEDGSAYNVKHPHEVLPNNVWKIDASAATKRLFSKEGLKERGFFLQDCATMQAIWSPGVVLSAEGATFPVAVTVLDEYADVLGGAFGTRVTQKMSSEAFARVTGSQVLHLLEKRATPGTMSTFKNGLTSGHKVFFTANIPKELVETLESGGGRHGSYGTTTLLVEAAKRILRGSAKSNMPQNIESRLRACVFTTVVKGTSTSSIERPLLKHVAGKLQAGLEAIMGYGLDAQLASLFVATRAKRAGLQLTAEQIDAVTTTPIYLDVGRIFHGCLDGAATAMDGRGVASAAIEAWPYKASTDVTNDIIRLLAEHVSRDMAASPHETRGPLFEASMTGKQVKRFAFSGVTDAARAVSPRSLIVTALYPGIPYEAAVPCDIPGAHAGAPSKAEEAAQLRLLDLQRGGAVLSSLEGAAEGGVHHEFSDEACAWYQARQITPSVVVTPLVDSTPLEPCEPGMNCGALSVWMSPKGEILCMRCRAKVAGTQQVGCLDQVFGPTPLSQHEHWLHPTCRGAVHQIPALANNASRLWPHPLYVTLAKTCISETDLCLLVNCIRFAAEQSSFLIPFHPVHRSCALGHPGGKENPVHEAQQKKMGMSPTFWSAARFNTELQVVDSPVFCALMNLVLFVTPLGKALVEQLATCQDSERKKLIRSLRDSASARVHGPTPPRDAKTFILPGNEHLQKLSRLPRQRSGPSPNHAPRHAGAAFLSHLQGQEPVTTADVFASEVVRTEDLEYTTFEDAAIIAPKHAKKSVRSSPNICGYGALWALPFSQPLVMDYGCYIMGSSNTSYMILDILGRLLSDPTLGGTLSDRKVVDVDALRTYKKMIISAFPNGTEISAFIDIMLSLCDEEGRLLGLPVEPGAVASESLAASSAGASAGAAASASSAANASSFYFLAPQFSMQPCSELLFEDFENLQLLKHIQHLQKILPAYQVWVHARLQAVYDDLYMRRRKRHWGRVLPARIVQTGASVARKKAALPDDEVEFRDDGITDLLQASVSGKTRSASQAALSKIVSRYRGITAGIDEPAARLQHFVCISLQAGYAPRTVDYWLYRACQIEGQGDSQTNATAATLKSELHQWSSAVAHLENQPAVLNSRGSIIPATAEATLNDHLVHRFEYHVQTFREHKLAAEHKLKRCRCVCCRHATCALRALRLLMSLTLGIRASVLSECTFQNADGPVSLDAGSDECVGGVLLVAADGSFHLHVPADKVWTHFKGALRVPDVLKELILRARVLVAHLENCNVREAPLFTPASKIRREDIEELTGQSLRPHALRSLFRAFLAQRELHAGVFSAEGEHMRTVIATRGVNHGLRTEHQYYMHMARAGLQLNLAALHQRLLLFDENRVESPTPVHAPQAVAGNEPYQLVPGHVPTVQEIQDLFAHRRISRKKALELGALRGHAVKDALKIFTTKQQRIMDRNVLLQQVRSSEVSMWNLLARSKDEGGPFWLWVLLGCPPLKTVRGVNKVFAGVTGAGVITCSLPNGVHESLRAPREALDFIRIHGFPPADLFSVQAFHSLHPHLWRTESCYRHAICRVAVSRGDHVLIRRVSQHMLGEQMQNIADEMIQTTIV